MTEVNKNLHQPDQQPEGAQHEPTKLELLLAQPIPPTTPEHQQFLDALTRATTAKFDNQP